VEALATFVADIALYPTFHHISVTIRKPSALPFAAAAGVKITRSHHAKEDRGDKEVYIALGSNLGDRVDTLEKALQLLEKHGIHIQDVSGFYESEPMYVKEQPQFLNAVCKVAQCISS
jgi:hypothetical protein